MADVTLIGLTTPFFPNTGLARFDKNSPLSLQEVIRMTLISPVPSVLITVESTVSNDLKITLDTPVLLLSIVEIHGSTRWNFGTPVTGSTTKQFILPITVLEQLRGLHNGGRN